MFKNEFRFHVEPKTNGAEFWDVFLLDFMSNYKNISYDVDNEKEKTKTKTKNLTVGTVQKIQSRVFKHFKLLKNWFP